MASALTSICLQTFYFHLRHDDTDSQLESLSREMAAKIKTEIGAMLDQALAICKDRALEDDRRYPHLVIRTNILSSQSPPGKSAPVTPYPYFGNVFWTDGGAGRR